MTDLLSGQHVVVTGASSGIGRAIALACARAGADVTLTFRANRAGAEAVAREVAALGRGARTLPLDLADPASCAALVEAAFADGPVHGWVHNAGADILTGAAAALDREAKLALVLDADVRGTARLAWAVAGRMQAQPGGGAMLTMSWDHVPIGMKGENPTVYSAAKGAVEAFSRSLAREVAPAVRVNILAPGFIATAFEQEASDAWRAWVTSVTPLARWGTPGDVAGAAVYLLSPAAAFVTGQVLRVNGGVV
ncbi:MAG: SDR family oxidoreductase [Gemmatimonadales bacterium]|nr:SDR family oxidoreductase [Gemmatimonadales bacterium]